jgi:hypothetical protein
MPSLILQPDETHPTCRDTFVGSGAYATSNFGGFEYLYLGAQTLGKGAQALHRVLLRFDLTALVGAQITAATLTLFQMAGIMTASETFTIHRLVQPNWTELGATWSAFNGVDAWLEPGGDFVVAPVQSLTIPSLQNLVFDGLQPLAEDAVRLRGGVLDLLIKGTLTSGLQYLQLASSAAATPANRPLLVVEYEHPVWCVESDDEPVYAVDTWDEAC